MSKFITEGDSLSAAIVTHGGGYDLEIFDEIEVEKYKCAVCKKVLKNAFQFTPDSNVTSRACHSCYTANTRSVIASIVFVSFSFIAWMHVHAG